MFSTLLLLSLQQALTSLIHRSAFPWFQSEFPTLLYDTTQWQKVSHNIMQTKSAESSTHPETPKRYQGPWRSGRRQSPRVHRKEGLQRGRGCYLKQITHSSSTPESKLRIRLRQGKRLVSFWHLKVQQCCCHTKVLQNKLNWKDNHITVISEAVYIPTMLSP